MSTRLFETFCDLLETVPPKAVIRAAEAERRMVVRDVVAKRVSLDDEALSVLGFCNFLLDAARGLQLCIPVWPLEHFPSYSKVLQKLVDAGELPMKVKAEVDSVFSRSVYQALASAA